MDITASGPMPDNRPDDDKPAVLSRALVVIKPDVIDEDFKEVPEKKGFLARLFSKATRDVILERGKDMAAGATITTAARLGSIAVMGGVGLTGLPLIMVGGVSAGVARTAWTIHKERKAHALETGEKLSFWQWAMKDDIKQKDAQGNVMKDDDGNDIVTSNKSKYLLSLGTSTAFATLGSSFMTYALPKIEEYAAPALEKAHVFLAPVVDKIKESEVLSNVGSKISSSISTAFAAVSGWLTFGKPDVTQVAAPADVKPATAIKSWDDLLANGPREMPTYVREILEPAKLPEIDPPSMDIQQRIDQAHALTAKPETAVPPQPQTAVQPSLEEAVAPVAPAPAAIPVGDRISALVEDSKLNRRWTAIAENAMSGNAQAQKDVAMAVLNGNGGFAKNPEQALEIYRAAADAGNMQAKVDLAYIEFHGLAGVESNPQQALETLRGYADNNKYARSMLKDLERVGVPASGGVKAALAAAATPASAAVPASADPIGDLIAKLPADAPAKVPQGSTLQVTWGQNADGTIEGVVENPPSWLKPGMQVEVPMVQIK